MDVDFSELRELEEDFGKIPARFVPKAIAVGDKAAMNIKQDWRQRWSGLAHAPHIPRAITYDRSLGAIGDLVWEIGPDKGRPQGPLANLLEFGSKNNAPIPGGLPAARAEEPRFEKATEDLLGEILEG